MRLGHKITIIAILAVAVPTSPIWGSVLFMILSIQYYGIIIASTPDRVFEEEFAMMPEVAAFIDRYPDYSTSHGGDIIAWKEILYWPNEGDALALHVKKSVSHGKVIMHGACMAQDVGGTRFDMPREEIIAYMEHDMCPGPAR
ncbi:MAG: hypothetical protein OXK17_09205 [Thaumarchaeota archaeon]|nr:hypothetical protein [Nitrososphaerota archaeon]